MPTITLPTEGKVDYEAKYNHLTDALIAFMKTTLLEMLKDVVERNKKPNG